MPKYEAKNTLTLLKINESESDRSTKPVSKRDRSIGNVYSKDCKFATQSVSLHAARASDCFKLKFRVEILTFADCSVR